MYEIIAARNFLTYLLHNINTEGYPITKPIRLLGKLAVKVFLIQQYNSNTHDKLYNYFQS